MSQHLATIEWSAAVSPEDFRKGRYSREHRWSFDGGVTFGGSSSPSVVPLPWSNPAHVDPEEAYVASIASCHMLTFLYEAAKAGFTITSYRDKAIGVMAKTAAGVAWVSRVTLAPVIAYAGEPPSAEQLAHLHHAAHAGCFIASSVKTEIVVGPAATS